MRALLSCFFIILRGFDLEKISPSVTWNLRGPLFTHSLAMPSIVFKIVRICNSQFKCNYLKKENLFLNFLFHFRNINQIWTILQKKMIAIANLFPKLQTVENLVRPLSKNRLFKTCFDSQHVKAPQILAKSPWECFYHVFYHSRRCWFRKCVPYFIRS